jgi:hypothetical protein
MASFGIPVSVATAACVTVGTYVPTQISQMSFR